MCHVADESSWIMNVKVSFVLSRLPIWHLAGMPKWNFEFLSETRRHGVAFIHLSFLSISLLYFCLSPDKDQCLLAVVINQNQPGSLCFALWPAQQVIWWAEWGDEWDFAKRHMLLLWHKARIFQADRGPGAERNLDLGLQIHSAWVHQQCSVKQVKQACLASPRQGMMLVWKLKTRDITWYSKWPQQIYSLIISLTVLRHVLIVINSSAPFLLCITLELEPFRKCSEQYLWICGYQWQDS